MSPSDLFKTSSVRFGDVLLQTLNSEVNNVPTDQRAGSSVTLVIKDETRLTMDASAYALYDAQGNENRFIILGFEAAVGSAACEGLVGDCRATLIRARRQLQASASSSSEVVTVAREYDFTASANVSIEIADRVQTGGMPVTDAQTTSLSAVSTVTAPGTADGSPLSQALSTNSFGAKLAQSLPNLRVEVVTTNIGPPALPPAPAPQDPLPMPPPPAPPGLPPSQPPPPSQTDFPVLVALLAVFCTGLIAAMGVLLYAKTHPKNIERARKKASTALTAIVPGHAAGRTPALPVRIAWSGGSEGFPAAASMHPSTASDVEAMTVREAGTVAMSDVGTSTDDLVDASNDAPCVSHSPPDRKPSAVRLKATSAKLLQQIVAQSQEDMSHGDPFASQVATMLSASRAASNAPLDGGIAGSGAKDPRWMDPAVARPGMSAFACAAPPQRPAPGASCLPATLPAPTRPSAHLDTVGRSAHSAAGDVDVAGSGVGLPQTAGEGTTALPPAQDPLWIADLREAADRRWAEFQQQRQQRMRAPMLAARFVARPQAQVLPSQRPRSPTADAP